MTASDSNLICAENIFASFDRNPVLKGLTLTAERGQFTSIIGPNGSGKTTLLRIMSGLLKADQGSVRFSGKKVTDYSMRERAKIFAVVQQRENNQFPFTCFETVLMGLHPHQSRFERVNESHMEIVMDAMALTGTDALSSKLISEISGGEFQRVILARAIVQQPQVLFLDEAMSELDLSARIRITKKLKKLAAEKQMTIISINHDLNLVYQFSDVVFAIYEGKLAGAGTPHDVLNPDFFKKVFSVDVEIYPGKGFLIRDEVCPK